MCVLVDWKFPILDACTSELRGMRGFFYIFMCIYLSWNVLNSLTLCPCQNEWHLISVCFWHDARHKNRMHPCHRRQCAILCLINHIQFDHIAPVWSLAVLCCSALCGAIAAERERERDNRIEAGNWCRVWRHCQIYIHIDFNKSIYWTFFA